MAAQSWEEAASLLRAMGQGMVRAGRLDTLAGWINSLPPDVLERHPPLMAYLGDVARGAPEVDALIAAGRALAVGARGDRVIPIEYAGRYQAAIGAAVPAGLPAAFLDGGPDPRRDLIARLARTRGPFGLADLAARYGEAAAAALAPTLAALVATGELVAGEFRPGGQGAEWIAADHLRTLRSRSLARVRRQIAPVPAAAYVRFLHAWHGVVHRRRGLDAVLDAIEKLQGLPVLASALEDELLPARVADYSPADLDTLAAAGEVLPNSPPSDRGSSKSTLPVSVASRSIRSRASEYRNSTSR